MPAIPETTTADWWSAPKATRPVTGTLSVPGSKSITNRALVLAALSDSPSFITGALVARDTSLMIDALRALGVEMSVSGHTVTTTPGPLQAAEQIDCGLAGTVMRFVPPVAALARGTTHFDGDAGARDRPLAPILEALRALGVNINDDGRGTLPFALTSTGDIEGDEITLDASASSQFVSGLLLAASKFAKGATIIHSGAELPSLPHIEMTIEMVNAAGGAIDPGPVPHSWTVAPRPLNLGKLAIEPDLSNASVYLAAAMVTGGRVTVRDWPLDTTQAGDQIREVFSAMGGLVDLTDEGLTITGPAVINGIDIDMHDIGELVPTIAAVAAFADSPSRLTGISHLRGHETNRLEAIVTELNRLGGAAEEVDDGIVVNPQALTSARLHSYHDHRMATLGAIIGLVVEGVEVENIATTSKTLPNFAEQWQSLIHSELA